MMGYDKLAEGNLFDSQRPCCNDNTIYTVSNAFTYFIINLTKTRTTEEGANRTFRISHKVRNWANSTWHASKVYVTLQRSTSPHLTHRTHIEIIVRYSPYPSCFNLLYESPKHDLGDCSFSETIVHHVAPIKPNLVPAIP